METNASLTRVHEDPGVPFLIRVLWFFLIGWHITFWWVLAAWVFNITILGLPVGVWMLDRVPLVLTLRMPRGYTVSQVEDGRIIRIDYGFGYPPAIRPEYVARYIVPPIDADP